MMGVQAPPQGKLYYTNFNLEQRVRPSHPCMRNILPIFNLSSLTRSFLTADRSPKTVVFSGTYEGGSFIVTVQDIGEPGKNDQFGITVTGLYPEVRSMRVISNGNIQFHK